MPWTAFFSDLSSGIPLEDIASKYAVSRELIDYRIRITGASNLYRARQKTRLLAVIEVPRRTSAAFSVQMPAC